ncbi:MAG: LPXTG cell wall anchor domain-containing protein [Lachnospiraceae bacterium]|nr:LPXTG cell wall anchor domain-containing protein [Lachnospiraceae bacterium]
MRKIYKWNGMLLLALVLALALGSRPAKALETAAAGQGQEAIPSEGVVYTVTYPDGSIVTENEAGEPLGYQDVLRLLQPENWKHMGSFATDKEGEILLPAAWSEGRLRILESRAPEGYLMGKEKEKTVDLKEGSVLFINPRDPGKLSPAMGDDSHLLLWVMLALSAGGGLLLLKRKDG